MNPLLSTFANGTVQIWEAVALMAVAVIPVIPRRSKRRHVELDNHTKHDIGIEPGSITWL